MLPHAATVALVSFPSANSLTLFPSFTPYIGASRNVLRELFLDLMCHVGLSCCCGWLLSRLGFDCALIGSRIIFGGWSPIISSSGFFSDWLGLGLGFV